MRPEILAKSLSFERMECGAAARDLLDIENVLSPSLCQLELLDLITFISFNIRML